MTASKKTVRIHHRGSGDLIAEGPVGWGITPFGGSWYISARYLHTDGFRHSVVPGLCFYKFVYLWLHFHATNGQVTRYLGWRYVLPNPLLPFIAFRVAVPDRHPDLVVTVEDPGRHTAASSRHVAHSQEPLSSPRDPIRCTAPERR